MQVKPAADLRRARGQSTRRALIEATLASVARHGLRGTTLSTLAEQAGVSRAAVNFHFGTKDQLLVAALDHALAIYAASLRDALGAPVAPAARLLAFMAHEAAFPLRHSDVMALWFAVWGEAHALDLYRAETLPHDRRYRNELREMVRHAARQPADVEPFTTLIMAFTFGVWSDHHLDPENYDIKTIATAAARIVALLGAGDQPPSRNSGYSTMPPST